MAEVPLAACEPVRRFAWRTRQRHRPGLQFVASTGRHHGFESIAEQRLLLALDFVGVREILAQPFRLKFQADGNWLEHVPDFVAVLPGGTWLVDVRPAGRIKTTDEVRFAATAEAAFAAGWGYLVVAGWRSAAMSVVDTLSAQRRPIDDPFGLRRELLALSAGRACAFGELVEAMAMPAVARAQLLHLLWRRELGVDLARPLEDRSRVWRAEASR